MIASGNHLLTQVKENQPRLRRRLEFGAAGRKPSGFAKSETRGRNRWETRELTVFPAKAWFRHTPREPFLKTVLWLQRTVCRRDPATGLCWQTSEVVFWVSSAHGHEARRNASANAVGRIDCQDKASSSARPFFRPDLELTPEVCEDHAAYIASWIEVLKNDKRAIFTAASRCAARGGFLAGRTESGRTLRRGGVTDRLLEA